MLLSSKEMFAKAMLILIDQGKKISINELEEICQAGKLYEFILKIGENEEWLKNMRIENLKQITDFLQGQINGLSGENKRKYGIENNGLCWLTQIAIESIQSF